MHFKERIKKIDDLYSSKYRNYKDRKDYKDDILKAIFLDDYQNHNMLTITKQDAHFINEHFQCININ